MRNKSTVMGTTCLLMLWSLTVLAAAPQEYKTEFQNGEQAQAAGWEVILGNAGKLGAARLMVVQDAAVGKTALRVEVRKPGIWQGIKLEDKIDLTHAAGMEFHIKQNVQTDGRGGCVVQIFFEDGSYALANVLMGKGNWTKIALPFRASSWTFGDRPKTFGKAIRIRFYPWRDLDTPGEFIQIDGLKFMQRKNDEASAAQGVTYTYRPPPSRGDPGHTILLDGKVSREEQAVFDAYGGDTVITFDVGEVQTLTEVTLKAFGKPAKNVASAQIDVSEDGKTWKPTGNISNKFSTQAEQEHKLSTQCLGVGRYVRLTLKRTQVDQALFLGEVILDRRPTVQADRSVRAAVYFEGPPLPPIPKDLAGDKNYHVLRGTKTIVAIHQNTGVVGGIWTAAKKQIVLRAWDRCVFENRDNLVESSEYADACRVVRQDDNLLILEATNKDLANLTVRKEYRLRANEREEWLEKITRFEYAGTRKDQFATLLSNLAITEPFRKDGYYEGVQVRNDRIAANEIFFQHVVPPNKGLMLVRPASGETITQYRHKVNDKFCCPYYSQVQSETYNTSSYNRHGWEIGNCTVKLVPGNSASVQVHTAILGDGRFGWERHYVSLPEYRSYVSDIKRPEWLGDVKGIFGDTYRAVLWGRAERTSKRYVAVIDDGFLVSPAECHMDGVWGDLPVSGNVTDLFGGLTPADELVRIFQSMKELPRYKAGLYMWLQSVHRASKVFQEHPEWFLEKNKAGEIHVVFPAHKPNFGRILSAPGHIEFILKQLTAFHQKYPQSVWYVDGGSGVMNVIDWKTLRISQDYHGQEFMRRMRQRFKQINPDGILFFNDAEDRAADIGYSEIGRHFGKEWRRTASRMYSCKVRQYFDPERLMSPLYWVGPGNTYLRVCAALGFPPARGGLETTELLEYAPYCSMAFETRGLQFSPTRLAPDWRQDAETLIEMHALRAGRGLVLSVISHHEKEVPQSLGAEVPPDLAKPNDTLYLVHHVLKDVSKYKVPGSDFAAKAAYRRGGWATGAVTELRAIQTIKVDARGWINFKTSLLPGLLHQFSVVKVPAFYWSRDGLRANLLLPAVRKHHTTAELENNALTVSITPADVERELLVLAPSGRIISSARVGNANVTCRNVALHGMSGAIITVPPAKSVSSVNVDFTDIPNAAEQAQITVPQSWQAGQQVEIAVQKHVGAATYCNIWRDGTLIYAGSHVVSGTAAAKLTLAVPEEAHNGNYVLEVGAGPNNMSKHNFTLSGHQSSDKIMSASQRAESTFHIDPTEKKRQDVTILSKGTAEFGGGRPSVDINTLTLRTEMPNETITYYGYCHAGIEVKGLQRAAIRIDHNMFPVRGLYPERNVLYERHADAFIGFFVDYSTPLGYAKRVAFSLGHMNLKRETVQPNWGRAKAPDYYLRLPSTIYTGEKVEGLLDLTRWAPPDWDGRVWISVVMDKTFRSRWLSLQLLQLNPSPKDVAPLKLEDVSGALHALRDRQIQAPHFATPIRLDGNLDEPAWEKTTPSKDVYIAGKPGQKSSQNIEIRVGYDTNFITIGITCWEKQKAGFATTNGAGGKPWFDDGIEFALAPPSWKGKFFHAIVNANAVSHQEIAAHKQQGKIERRFIPIQCKAMKHPDRFVVEIAVPLGAKGLPAPQAGESWKAQFMRNRVMPSGAREYCAWTVTDSYHDFTRFGTVIFE